MPEAKPGDIIYLTKRAKSLGTIVKVRVVKSDHYWWLGVMTASDNSYEKYVTAAEYEATEQAARDEAEELIAKEIAVLERRLAKLRGFLGNIKLIDRT